jgi:uridylate kinase
VDGVYDRDPEQHKNAKFYSEISYIDVLKKDLQVMDLTAITLCKENQLPLAVFNMRKKGSLKKAVLGEHVGTIVRR